MSKKILIIDDEVDLVKVLELRIQSLHYETDHAGTLEEALAKVVQSKPDCILLDYFLPDGNGDVFSEKIKNIAGCDHIPIIFMSASSDKMQELSLKSNYETLVKPIDPEKLSEVLKLATG